MFFNYHSNIKLKENMELYQKVYHGSYALLAEYSDYSRKIAFIQKKNNHVVLAKMYPTSKRLDKLLFAAGLEIPLNALPLLIRALGTIDKRSEDELFTIFESESFKKQRRRLVFGTQY